MTDVMGALAEVRQNPDALVEWMDPRNEVPFNKRTPFYQSFKLSTYLPGFCLCFFLRCCLVVASIGVPSFPVRALPSLPPTELRADDTAAPTVGKRPRGAHDWLPELPPPHTFAPQPRGRRRCSRPLRSEDAAQAANNRGVAQLDVAAGATGGVVYVVDPTSFSTSLPDFAALVAQQPSTAPLVLSTDPLRQWPTVDVTISAQTHGQQPQPPQQRRVG